MVALVENSKIAGMTGDSNPHYDSPRNESQRFRLLGHAG